MGRGTWLRDVGRMGGGGLWGNDYYLPFIVIVLIFQVVRRDA